jgi:hypothetical protein
MVSPTAPAIPLKMYRHFAVVTLALTSAIALFADGENRAAVAEHIAEQQQANALRRESRARFGAPRLVGTQPTVVGSFDDEPGLGDAFGAPMDGAGSRSTHGGSGIDPAEGAQQLGYSQEYLDSLSPVERELLLKGLEQNGLLADETRSRQAAAIDAASARRSGSPSSSE